MWVGIVDAVHNSVPYTFFIFKGDMVLQRMVEMAINFLAPFSNFKPHLFQHTSPVNQSWFTSSNKMHFI